MNHLIKPFQINIEKVIESKNPKLLKLLPSPLLSYIKRIIHLEEFNQFLIHTQHDYNYDLVNEIIKYVQVSVESSGLDNIPERGGCIIACNHPLGGMDGIAILNEVSKKRTDIKVLANDIIMNLKNLNDLLIPINKHGNNLINNIKRIDRSYASGDCIVVFPAGLVSRRQKGKIMDLEWKKSFISKATKYKRNIIPIHVDARNSNFFYNLALFRKTIGIKTNIEMFYLLDEAYKQKGKSIKLTIGAPISHSFFTKDHPDSYWAHKVKQHVYGLRDNRKIF